MVLKKIISGAQTGADQGALDGAISNFFSYGGAIPAGRKTEAGPLAKKYEMDVLTSSYYPDRTIKNVEDADGTLIVSHGRLTGGSALTFSLAVAKKKPCFHMDFDLFDLEYGLKNIIAWLNDHHIEILNVAGPRSSSDPKIYELTRKLITLLIEEISCCYDD